MLRATLFDVKPAYCYCAAHRGACDTQRFSIFDKGEALQRDVLKAGNPCD
jgi:hypothetical protein